MYLKSKTEFWILQPITKKLGVVTRLEINCKISCFVCYFSKNPVVAFTEVSIVKHMEDKICSESQNVMFQVEVSHSGIDPVWTFKSQLLKASPKYKMESKGKIHTLTVVDAMKDEEGQYTFHAGEKTSSANLTVSGMLRNV